MLGRNDEEWRHHHHHHLHLHQDWYKTLIYRVMTLMKRVSLFMVVVVVMVLVRKGSGSKEGWGEGSKGERKMKGEMMSGMSPEKSDGRRVWWAYPSGRGSSLWWLGWAAAPSVVAAAAAVGSSDWHGHWQQVARCPPTPHCCLGHHLPRLKHDKHASLMLCSQHPIRFNGP